VQIGIYNKKNLEKVPIQGVQGDSIAFDYYAK